MPADRRRLPCASAIVLGVLSLAGCGLHISPDFEARDSDWKRTYDVAAGAELDVRNGNGTIRVEAGDGKQIVVTATRIVRAMSEDAARSALSDVKIEESASANRVLLDASTRGLGLSFGMSRRVDFDIKVPRGVNVVLKGSNGEITASGITGSFRATTSNGMITADGIEGPAQVETTNGRIDLRLARVAESGVSCETTNGEVRVSLPADAKVRVSARVTNGMIDTGDLKLVTTEQTRRRLEGTIGGGGPLVRLETTNGRVMIRGK